MLEEAADASVGQPGATGIAQVTAGNTEVTLLPPGAAPPIAATPESKCAAPLHDGVNSQQAIDTLVATALEAVAAAQPPGACRLCIQL